MTRAEIGARGEASAAQYLEAHGYQIVVQNFRTRAGEIDLIAQTDQFLTFTEVKTRESAQFASARCFVTIAKQRRIIAAASAWLVTHPTALQPRFDVIEVYWHASAPAPYAIYLYENAFEA